MSIPCTLGDGLALEGLHPLVRAVVDAAVKMVYAEDGWLLCAQASSDKFVAMHSAHEVAVDSVRALVAAMEEKHE